MASSSTVTSSSTHVATSGAVNVPGCLTAMPSASVTTGPAGEAPPAYGTHTAACTPITRTWGSSDLTAMAVPAARPPPPTGTMTHDRSGTSSTSSSPSVPWPATTAGSSKGWQNAMPVSSARARAAFIASSSEAPPSTTVAP